MERDTVTVKEKPGRIKARDLVDDLSDKEISEVLGHAYERRVGWYLRGHAYVDTVENLELCIKNQTVPDYYVRLVSGRTAVIDVKHDGLQMGNVAVGARHLDAYIEFARRYKVDYTVLVCGSYPDLSLSDRAPHVVAVSDADKCPIKDGTSYRIVGYRGGEFLPLWLDRVGKPGGIDG